MEQEDGLCFEDGCIGGRGGLQAVIDPVTYKIGFEYRHWDSLYVDRSCRRPDLKGCRYIFVTKWVSYSDARVRYGMGEDEMEADTLDPNEDSVGKNLTDEVVWDDKKNQRVRVVEAWIREEVTPGNPDGEIWRYELNSSKILTAEQDPYSNPERPEGVKSFNRFPFVMFYVKHDRRGSPYGLVSNMIEPQDLIDMHAAKGRFELLTIRSLVEKNALDMSEREYKEQIADPASYIKLKDGGIEKIKIDEGQERARMHIQLSQAAQGVLRLASGINSAFEGVSSRTESGKALQHREQRSRKILSKVFGNARRSMIVKGKMLLELIAHWYTEDRIIRITNATREKMKMASDRLSYNDEDHVSFNSAMMASLEFDVSIDKAPADPNIQHEQYMGLIELKKSGSPIPEEEIVQTSDLVNKEKIIDGIRQMRQQAAQPSITDQAKAQKDMADAQLKAAQAQAAMLKAQLDAQSMQAKSQMDAMRIQVEQIKAKIDVEHKAVDARRLDGLDEKTRAETQEVLAKVQAELAAAEKDRAEQDKIRAETRKILEEIRAGVTQSPAGAVPAQ